jgi:hypothetical protein
MEFKSDIFYLMDISSYSKSVRLPLKCDGTSAENRFRLSVKWTCPFKSAGTSAQSPTGSRVVGVSGSNGSNAGYTMFPSSVKNTGYPLHSPVSPSLPRPCVTACHHVSTGIYSCLFTVTNVPVKTFIFLIVDSLVARILCLQ